MMQTTLIAASSNYNILEPSLLTIPINAFMKYDHFYLFDLVAYQPPYIRHHTFAPYETSLKLTNPHQCFEYKGISSQSQDGDKIIAGPITSLPRNDQLGCEPFSYNLTGKTVILRRGGCNFDTKLRHAYATGAQAVVITREDDDPSFRPYVSEANHEIPCILLNKQDSLELLGILASSDFNTVIIEPLPPLPDELEIHFLGRRVSNIVIINSK